LDALFAKARHYATIGDCEESLKAYDEILALKKVSSGKKIDATLDKMRVAFFTLVRNLFEKNFHHWNNSLLLLLLFRINLKSKSC
jgi:hypothetical protein